jgi:hypothetical protein
MQKNPSTQTKFTSAFIAFLITATLEALVWHLVTQEVLLKLKSIPELTRHGYDNPFIDLLAISSGFLFVGIILYWILITLFVTISSSMALKMILGAVTGLLPIICGYLITFGIPISNPAGLLELSVMAVAGGMFPFVYEKVMIFLQSNRA